MVSSFFYSQGRVKLAIVGRWIGPEDVVIELTGGDHPHIGAVALAQIRPSLKNPNERGMGTTAVGVIKAHIGTFIFNVGDSRIYADYNNELIQMSEDHSVIAQLLKEGKITLDGAKSHTQKNTLTNALGVWHVFRIDINKIENTYKYLLVSSDGLHGYVEKKVISDIVHDSSLSLQEKTETLIARANQSGGYDNCTVILMENDGE